MINFLSFRKYSYIFSLFLTLVMFFYGFVHYQKHGYVFSYSVEFSGGKQLVFSIDRQMSAEEIADQLKKCGCEGAVVRQFSGQDFLLRVKEKDLSNQISSLEKDLSSILSGKVSIQSIEVVGSGIGNELKYRVVIAILVALVCMFLYVWIRFKGIEFAISNVISLLHDVLMILLFALFFEYEFSLDMVGAVLFILGYSINDTIVIFSKIREKFFASKKDEELGQLVNSSIHETLRRTLLTSFFTTLVVIPLVLYGGTTLKTLSTSLLFGIIFGTYSSIFIAAPLVYDIKKKFRL